MTSGRRPVPGQWLFRLTILAYPRSFRRRYGTAMVDAYVHERGARGRYPGSVMRFWAWILADTLLSALSERLARWRRAPRPVRNDLPPTPHQTLLEMIHDLIRDIRFGYRSLALSPGFAVTALLILSLGIGATAIVFTVADTVFLTSPPHLAEADRLVRLTRTTDDSVSNELSYPDYLVFAERNRSFSGLLAYDPSGVALTVKRGSDQLTGNGWYVSANYFDVLGVPMEQGRGFAADEDDVIGEGAVVVVSYPFWRDALGGDDSIVGQTLVLNDTPVTVIGVAPDGFRGASPVQSTPDLWVPVTLQPTLAGRSDEFLVRIENQTINWLETIGRLQPDATIEQAGADAAGVNAYLVENFGNWNEGQGAHLSRAFMFNPDDRDQLIRFTRLLGLVVATVLLIVCANVAILQLARASSRRHEVGVRAALGAGRARLVRQLLTESLLLSAGGVIGGYLVAHLGAGAIGALIPMNIAVAFVPDASVLAFAAAVGVLSAVVFGLAPAVSLSRIDVVESLSGRGTTDGRSLVQSGLVIVQVAASLVLVTGAMLFVRSLLTAGSVDPGFERQGRVFLDLNLSSHGYDDDAGLVMLDESLERIRALPRVESATVAVLRPFRGSWRSTFNPGGDDAPDEDTVSVYLNRVGEDYFSTMGLELIEGRAFDTGDSQGSDSVVMVNRAAAEIIWPGERALGQTLELMRDGVADRVIGVVENTNYRRLGEEALPVVYAALRQYPNSRVVFAVATTGDSAALVPEVRDAILSVDPGVALSGVITVEDALDEQLGTYRLGARAVGAFAALGALLAAIGIYGVLSYSVATQRREIGIRLALGDTRRRTIGRVVSRGLRVASVGVVVGLAVAFLAVRLIASMLFGVEPHDPLSFMAVPLMIVAITCAASWLPARRAATVEPAEALRAE